MLRLIPFIANEPDFALFGGTAINMFVRNMPRVSVDIDLIYVHIHDRSTSLLRMDEALDRLGSKIKTVLNNAYIEIDKETKKLFVRVSNALVKIE